MIPKEPTPEMIEAGQASVSGFPRAEAVATIWRAMWEVAAQGIEARSDTTGTGVAEGESPVAKPCAQKETP